MNLLVWLFLKSAAILAFTLWIACDFGKCIKNSNVRFCLFLLLVPCVLQTILTGLQDGIVARQKEREAQARTEIQTTFAELERAVSHNDFDRALEFVSEDSPQTRALVARNRSAVRIKEAGVRDLRVELLDLNANPPRAIVSLHASVKGSAVAWPTPIRLPYMVELDISEVELRREKDGVWRLQDRYLVKSTAL